MVVKFVFNCFSVRLNVFIKIFSFSVSIVNYNNPFCNVEPFLDDWCAHYHTHTHVHHSVFGFSTKFLRYSLNLLGDFSIFYYVLGNLYNAPKKLLVFLACFLFNWFMLLFLLFNYYFIFYFLRVLGWMFHLLLVFFSFQYCT